MSTFDPSPYGRIALNLCGFTPNNRTLTSYVQDFGVRRSLSVVGRSTSKYPAILSVATIASSIITASSESRILDEGVKVILP
jgi:hypothetical protein